MKESKAIKKFKKGKIQIENDDLDVSKILLPKLTKWYLNNLLSCKSFLFDFEYGVQGFSTPQKDIKLIKMSSITPNKPTIKQRVTELEKKYDEITKTPAAKMPEKLAIDAANALNTEKVIDWSKPQIVHFNEKKFILTNGEHSDQCFSGTVIKNEFSDDFNLVGTSSINWLKSTYKTFKGEITIKQ